MILARFAHIVCLASAFCAPLALHASPLEYKVFTPPSTVWMVNPQGILVYGTQSKSLRRIHLDEMIETDTIVDAVESDDMLWISATSGLYRIDLNTATTERISFPGNSYSPGKVAADLDYVWLACTKTLWQYDKLTEEWLELPRESEDSPPVLGAYSDGDDLYLVAGNGTQVFSILDEKWNSYPLGEEAPSKSSWFFPDDDGLYVIDGSRMLRYVLESKAWETVDTKEPIVDLALDDSLAYLLTANSVFVYRKESSLLQPLNISGLKEGAALTLRDSLVVVTMPGRILEFDRSSQSSTYLEHPPRVAKTVAGKALYTSELFLSLYPADFSAYDHTNAVWETVPFASLKRSKNRLFWDDNGMGVKYTKDASTVLRGNAGIDVFTYRTKPAYDTTFGAARMVTDSAGTHIEYADTTLARNDSLYYGQFQPKLNLTLHNELAGGRYVDLYFDNSIEDIHPEKGAYYRGLKEDRFNSARIGTNDLHGSPTLPKAMFEGAQAVVESHARLEKRDRKIVRTTFGGGLLVSQTRNEILDYAPDGRFKLAVFRSDSTTDTMSSADSLPTADTLQIVPGSAQLWIDGEEVPQSDFSLFPSSGVLQLSRLDLMDPTSTVNVEYDVRTVPDSGVSTIEIVPENNFGPVGYLDATVSPTEWISPRLGFYTVGSSDLNKLVSVGTNLEFRKPKLLLKFDPELTYDVDNNALAAGGQLQSRLGTKTSLVFNGLVADTSFVTTNSLTRGYGAIQRELDYRLSYDILKEIPVSYYQHNRRSVDGTENRYELSLGINFPTFPFLDVSLSRNLVDIVAEKSTQDSSGTDSTWLDTLDRRKDKLRLRLYETSSPHLQKLIHFSKVGYELAYTLFRSTDMLISKDYAGGVFYGRATISPIHAVTLVGTGTYRRNPGIEPSREIIPELVLQTINMPQGVDFLARYKSDIDRFGGPDSTYSNMIRLLDVKLNPGTWWSPLRWFSLLGGVSQTVISSFNTFDPSLRDLLSGTASVTNDTRSRTAGAKIFPNERIDLQNRNTWTTVSSGASDTLLFQTLNDLHVEVASKTYLKGRWRYTANVDTRAGAHDGELRLDKTWAAWISSRKGATAAYTTTDTTRILRIGPKIEVTLNGSDLLFLKTLLSSHSVTVNWYRNDGSFEPGAEVIYLMYLRALVKPNISLVNTNTLRFRRGEFGTLTGGLQLTANF